MQFPIRGIPYKVDTDIKCFVAHKICLKLRRVIINHKDDGGIDKVPFENVVE